MPLPILLDKELYDAISTDTTLTHNERQLFIKWYELETKRGQQEVVMTTIEGNGNTQYGDDDGNDDTSKRIQYKLKQDYR